MKNKGHDYLTLEEIRSSPDGNSRAYAVSYVPSKGRDKAILATFEAYASGDNSYSISTVFEGGRTSSNLVKGDWRAVESFVRERGIEMLMGILENPSILSWREEDASRS
jgi:hypothetical protein